MDIYQLSKYQNIGDRLKRLANSSNNNKEKLSQTLNPQTIKQNQNGNMIRKDNFSFDEEIKPKYAQNYRYTNLNTTQQRKLPQQYTYRIKQLNSPIQHKQSQQILRKSINNRLYQKRIEKPEEKLYTQKQSEEKQQNGNNKRILQKVRSEGTIKIEEILESFNNYKQNKQKFISTLGRRQTAQTEYIQQQQPRQTRQQIPQVKKTVFKPIDNIWNENQDEDSNPKFKRSLKSFRDGYEQLDLFSAMREPEMQENKPKTFSKSKLIQRNITSYEPQLSQKSALTRLLSPRSRIPGKICKNKDRLFTKEDY